MLLSSSTKINAYLIVTTKPLWFLVSLGRTSISYAWRMIDFSYFVIYYSYKVGWFKNQERKKKVRYLFNNMNMVLCLIDWFWNLRCQIISNLSNTSKIGCNIDCKFVISNTLFVENYYFFFLSPPCYPHNPYSSNINFTKFKNKNVNTKFQVWKSNNWNDFTNIFLYWWMSGYNFLYLYFNTIKYPPLWLEIRLEDLWNTITMNLWLCTY